MANYDNQNEFDDDFYDDEDTQKDKYLTFKIAKEDYGIEIRHVMEIIKIQKITKVPETEDYLKGVINLRGQIIPVIDVRLRFQKEEREFDDRTCIVVVSMNELQIGMIVDRVSEVLDIPEKNVNPAPTFGRKATNKYIQGMGKVGDDVKIILDVNKLLKDEVIEGLKEMAKS